MTAAAPSKGTEADTDRGYFRERAAEERDAAARASCMVRDVHLELADLYAARGAPNLPAAK